MNDRIKEIRARLLAIENDEYMLLSDEMLDVKFLLGEIERLRAVRERFKFYGTTGCNECEDGRVTLFVANEKCISCSPSSYEKESVITNYGILTAQLMKVAHEALEFYAKGFTSFENVEENAKPPCGKAWRGASEMSGMR